MYYFLFELICNKIKPAELLRRRHVKTLMLAATPQAAACSGSLSQTLCSAVKADLAPLRLSFKNNQDFLSTTLSAPVDRGSRRNDGEFSLFKLVVLWALVMDD